MDFGLKKARSTTGANKNISVTSGILIGATLLFAGVAVAQTAADKQVESIRPDRLPPEQIVLSQEEPIVQVQEVSEPQPSLDTMTPYQWGSLSVYVMNTDPATWETHKHIQRSIHGRCGEWHDLAISVGWPKEEWPILSKVLYRESRCNIGSHNQTDPNSGSRGLMQINGYWCRKSQWTQRGWLQDNNILQTCEDLYHPTTNLQAGLAIWYYGEIKHGCGWRGPWATKCS